MHGSCLKPKIKWVDENSEFYNTSVNLWLEDNVAEIYSIHNEGKSAAVEWSIKTLNN